MAANVARCGSESGYKRHQRRGEKPCDACTSAKADYDQRWRSAPRQTQRNRLHARAASEARITLARKYPDEYRTLYQAARARLYAENDLAD